MGNLGLGYGRSPIVKTQVWWTTIVVFISRRRCDFEGGQKLRRVMLVLLAVWWSVSLGRMKTGCTGLVLARQRVLATKNGWDGIFMIRIACYAKRIVNSGSECMLREGGQLPLMK